ncbi:Threonylcarbamoyladenosine tRNA methylthiotransferase MtaB [Polaribacter huanghezhanensis]|nr:Threonylcarbamoyladenosine tRNA methylthiotransferase MtaB [Polaribacter huanghezhanensis]
MNSYFFNKITFKVVTFIALFLSISLFVLGATRFIQIDFLLDFLPKYTRVILNGSSKWIYYAYSLTVVTNFLAVLLLYKRNILSVPVSKYSAIGMIVLISHHFYITEYIPRYEAVEMFLTLMFYLFLAWFIVKARANGYLSKFSKEKTSVSLKIQEGCDHECAYCPIPSRKGSSKSDTLKNILANAESMALEGIKDVFLIGDNIGDYGTGENGGLKHLHSFYDLLNELDKIGDISRFTFLSITTPMFSERTLRFIKNSKRISPYFNIRMDSASDEMLKKMNRPFPLKPYKELFINIKRLMPDAYIIVEILVGFPGETDALFNETVRFLQEADVSYIRTTVYTAKVGTKAFGTLKKDAVPKSVCNKRKNALIGLSKIKLHTFYESQLGKEKFVLFENKIRKGSLYGYTNNGVKVKTVWDSKLGNTLHEVRLTGIKRSTMLFEFLESEILIDDTTAKMI